MADMTFTSSNYAGQAAVGFVAPAILSADTIANGFCTVLENVRYKTNLRKVTNGTISTRSCAFSAPDTALDISDVQLTLTELQVNEEICNHELARTWAAEQMRGNFAGVPGDYEQFLAQYLAARVAEQVEKNIWQGNYAYDGGTAANTLFNGIMNPVGALTGSNVSTVDAAFTAAEPGSGTNTGIGKLLGDLVAQAPAAIMGDPEAKIYMSRKTFQLYFQFLAANNNNPVLATQMAKSYLGYEIITPAGFPDDTLLLSKKDNLYFGTNVLTDHTEARFIDLRGTTGADLTRIVMLFDGGTQIVDGGSLAVVKRVAAP